MDVLTNRKHRWLSRQDAQTGGIDETGTVNVAGLEEEGAVLAREMEQVREEERQALRGVDPTLLTVHGTAPGSKQDGTCRLLYENINGISTKMSGNKKLDKAKQLIDELEADIVAYNEIRVNWKHKGNVNGLAKMFHGGELEIRAVAGHNAHDHPSGRNQDKIQEGGTALLTYGRDRKGCHRARPVGSHDFSRAGQLCDQGPVRLQSLF